VVVHFDGRSWVACRGDHVDFGRSRACQIRLPNDDHISRRAGSLVVLDDCVMIRNESRQKPLVVRPPTGEDRVVEPGAATTSLPFQRFDLLVTGNAGSVVAIRVDAARLTPAGYAYDPKTRSPNTKAEPLVLSRSQQRILRALCAPLLSESGPKAVPATYAQIAQRLGLQPQYVRNVVKALRETLSGHGVPGLVRQEDDATHDDFRWALARWAVRSGWVTVGDLDGDDDRD
jgi:hypothetical protein